MRLMHLTLVIGLVLATAGLGFAQMNSDQDSSMGSDQMSPSQPGSAGAGQTDTMGMMPQATWQAGPIVRTGFPAAADVMVNGRLAIRVPASAAGLSPSRRAEIIADRLNQNFAAGMTWNDARIGTVGQNWTVLLGDNIIATADTNSARAFRVSPPSLASTWARQTVVALGGQPSLVATAISPSGAVSIPGGVAAGVGQVWTTAFSKSVPLINAQSGDDMGMVTVAGPQSQLNMVNSVAVYMTTGDNGAQVWTFVPITGTSVSDTLSRVQGVGLISVPSSLAPSFSMVTGGDMMSDVSQYSTRWNSYVNTTLGNYNLRSTGASKVVPLYSADQNMVIGAAQVIGSSSGVANTQAVIVSGMDTGMLRFSATSDAGTSLGMNSPSLNNVVVSSLIFMPSTASPGTTGAGPGMAPDESTQPPSTDSGTNNY